MDVQKQDDLIKEAFEIEAEEIGFCLDQLWGDYENPYENSDTALAFNLFKKGWLAKAQAVPEGFVLVPKDKISHFYQDNDEPENFCNSSNDWDCLGDGIDKDQIMIVNKHTQANISTEKFYGAWKLIETSYGTRWKFELFKSESEAKQAMIEAQEQSHECPNP
ncbi:hypothetical protein [Acinetobacter johnsonii]|uniref:hypothetical protein n=1 Tax=Acinetobacter johnsonii TaxID=40214 RepID=UPI00300910EA